MNITECKHWPILFKTNACCNHLTCVHNIRETDGHIYKGKRIHGIINDYLKECHSCACLIWREATLNEIAEIYGLTRERIRQVEEMALNKISGGEHS